MGRPPQLSRSLDTLYSQGATGCLYVSWKESGGGDMWDSLWIGGPVATLEEQAETPYGFIPHGGVAVKDGLIEWVGDSAKLPGAPKTLAKEVFDLGGALMTPGLIDCHTHLVYGGDRSHEFEARLLGKSYKDIARAGGGIMSTVKATRAATQEALLSSALSRLDAFLREGVTTIEIKSGYGLDLESEMKMLRAARQLADKRRVRIKTTFLGAHAVPLEFKDKPDQYIDYLSDFLLPSVHREGLADAVDGFCESIGFSAAQIQRLFDKAAALDLPVKLHAEQLSNQGGAALAAAHQALSADHLEYVDQDGVRQMAANGTVAVLLPGAYYYLNETRKPPVDMLRQSDVPIAIATDCNPGTSPMTSLLLAMNMACILFGLTPEEALAGTTRNAAKALGLDGETGVLQTGLTADLAIWNVPAPSTLSYGIGYNPLKSRIFAGHYDT